MAQIEDLPADQQAVLRLLLTQDRSYEEIARSLRMAPAAVRDRAHEALSKLGPADTALSIARRGELTDYLLGQQDDATAEGTRAYLADAPGAKAWSRVVIGELRPMTAGPLPEIPEAPPQAPAAPNDDEDDDPGAIESAPAPRTRTAPAAGRRSGSRAGGAVLLASAGVLAALAIGFFVGRATKGDSEKTASTPAGRSAAADVLGQANLAPPKGAPAPKALGIAQFVERDGQKLINVIAEGLPRAPKDSGYGIWLTAADQEPVWLGYFQAVSSTGQVGAQNRLPVDPAKYQTVLLTRQTGRAPKVPATTFLTGTVKLKKS